MIRGSCLCGKVRYEISGSPLHMYCCHCGMCRKATGSAFATNMWVRVEDLIVVSGKDNIMPYRSSPGEFRHFCAECGSPLFSEAEHRRGILSIRCGLLDDDPRIRPSQHIYTAFKAPWFDVTDRLPAYPEAPPQSPDDPGRRV